MTNILFFMVEGLPKTILDSQVLEHSLRLQEHGIEMEIWSMVLTRTKWNEGKERINTSLRNFPVQIRLMRGVRGAFPFSSLINRVILAIHLARSQKHFDAVHCRTEHATFIWSWLKHYYPIPLIWDCRGDTVAELLEESDPKNGYKKLIRQLRIFVIKRRVTRALKTADSSIFISRRLMANVVGKRTAPNPVFIPCVASERRFFFSTSLRFQFREMLGWVPNDKVIVYSGSMAHYQNFTETVQLVKQWMEHDKDIFFLVLTPHVYTAREIVGDALLPSRHRIIPAEYLQINGFLNAADFAIMTRRTNKVNEGAIPVKFSEYCLAGLPVIMNDSMPESEEIAKKLGNLIKVESDTHFLNLKPVNNKVRIDISRKAKEVLSWGAYLEHYLRLYRTGLRNP